jgi:imidazoleglycerol phosphate dehydratase HisB
MSRIGDVRRTTAETDVRVRVDLDGTGTADVATGVGFFDHMLRLLARHALVDLEVRAEGDLETGSHHTVEDVGISRSCHHGRLLRTVRRRGAASGFASSTKRAYRGGVCGP